MENFLYNVGVDWLACLAKPDRPAKKGRKGEQMKVKSRFLALLLAMVMALGLMIPAAASEEAAPADNSGKIVILHTNDVHGAVENYAKVATLKKMFADAGAEVLLVDAGDFSQGET